MLENGHSIFDESKAFPLLKFYDKLVGTISEGKRVYPLGAEVIGIALAQKYKVKSDKMDDGTSENSVEGTFEQILKGKILAMFKAEEHLRVLTVLANISKHCPQFTKQFFTQVFSNMKKYVGETQVVALKLIRTNLSEIDEAFLRMKPYLNDWIRHRDEDAQQASLEILRALLQDLDNQQVIIQDVFLRMKFLTFPRF